MLPTWEATNRRQGRAGRSRTFVEALIDGFEGYPRLSDVASTTAYQLFRRPPAVDPPGAHAIGSSFEQGVLIAAAELAVQAFHIAAMLYAEAAGWDPTPVRESWTAARAALSAP